MDKRGSSFFTKIVRVVFVFGLILFLLAIVNYLTGGGVESFLKGFSWDIEYSTLNVTNKDFTSYSTLLKNDRVKFLDYIFGGIPNILIEKTGEIGGKGEYSAVIVMIGIWVFLFFVFSDIASLFSTFNQYTAWIVGFVLTVIVANFKLINYLALYGLILSSKIVGPAFFVFLIILFVLFILGALGVEWIRTMIEERKKSEERLRAMMRGARASAGIEAAEKFGEAAAEGE